MTLNHLSRLNRILGDKMGLIPAGYKESGGSAFRFMRSKDLVFPFRKGVETKQTESGLHVVVPVFEMGPQLPGEQDCWCIARWLPPGWNPGDPDCFGELEEQPRKMTPEEWAERYPGLGWPQDGWWMAVVPLKPDYEPTEAWAQWAIDHLDWQRRLSLRETYNLIMERLDKNEKAYDSEVQTILRNVWVNHVPGARGGDYLAFTEPLKGN
jgi:hypothetical protein